MAITFSSPSLYRARTDSIRLGRKGKLADDELGQNLRLRNIQLVIRQISDLRVVHVECHTVIHDTEGDWVTGLTDGQSILTELHVGPDEVQLFLGQRLVILGDLAELMDLRYRQVKLLSVCSESEATLTPAG